MTSLLVQAGGSLPSLQSAQSVGDGLGGYEAPREEEVPAIGLALASHHGLETYPASLARQSLRVLEEAETRLASRRGGGMTFWLTSRAVQKCCPFVMVMTWRDDSFALSCLAMRSS
jgi:hypothetical protein